MMVKLFYKLIYKLRCQLESKLFESLKSTNQNFELSSSNFFPNLKFGNHKLQTGTRADLWQPATAVA